MQKAILGFKKGMTHVIDEKGMVVPVTVVESKDCYTVKIKKEDSKDGYNAVVLGIKEVKLYEIKKPYNQLTKREKAKIRRRMNKPLRRFFEKLKLAPLKYLREVRVDNFELYKEREKVQVDIFKKGDIVDVSGISKGKGFAGGMKRWHFSGQGASHGSEIHRKPASNGATDPARVFKGSKRPGHLGAKKITVKNLQIVDVLKDKNVILVKGAIPGPNGGLVVIKESLNTAKKVVS